MGPNYVFAFRPLPKALPSASLPSASLPSAPKALPSAPLPSGPAAKSQSDRFSLNRLMNYKATGGCRSCG